jgi:glycosyltransferase involved in cell wall biosynthesis
MPAISRVVDGILVHDVKFGPGDFFGSLLDSSFRLPLSGVSRFKEACILLSYSRGIEKLVRKHDVDLIHAHFAYPEGSVGLTAKNRTGRPLLVTLHGCGVLVEPTVSYGSRIDLEIDHLVGRVLQEADEVIAGSSATYNIALKLGCSRSRLSLIPNAVDLRRFSLDIDKFWAREKLGLADRPIVFTLRPHEPQKGIEYLIDRQF